MAATLTTLRDRVETILADTGNAIWSEDDLDECIRQALHEYSRARPQSKITTLSVTSATRELDTSSITGLMEVVEVWCDYDATDPDYPPNIRPFRYWRDANLLYITGDYEPQTGDTARIFYVALHTLDGLDSETSTSLPTEHESTLVIGAAGLAAYSPTIDQAEEEVIDKATAAYVKEWGRQKLDLFRQKLREAAYDRQDVAHVDLPDLDRFDDKWA